MKQTIKTSRVAGQLEKMFRLLNNHFYGGQLPEVVISLKKTVGAYGHFTCGKVWQAGDERRYEINISSATLNRPIEQTCSTLLHEMAHLGCAVGYGNPEKDENGNPLPIKDTSGSGNTYHNKRFKAIPLPKCASARARTRASSSTTPISPSVIFLLQPMITSSMASPLSSGLLSSMPLRQTRPAASSTTPTPTLAVSMSLTCSCLLSPSPSKPKN